MLPAPKPWKRGNPWGSRGLLAAALLLAAGAAGCGGDPAVAPPPSTPEAHVVLPGYPYVENDAIRIDTGLLDDLAGSFLQGGGAVHQVPSFLFLFVPVRAFDRIARGFFDGIEEQEGLLYLSGYFGGVWLKQALQPGDPGSPAAASPPLGGASLATGIFSLLASATADLNETLRRGDAEAIRDLLHGSLDIFLYLYGYNLGYLESILERPPAGVEPPPGYLACSGFLGCRTPVQGISVLEELLALTASLESPPDERWAQMKAKVDALGPAARAAGSAVWSGHLSTERMLPDDYFTLLDLSAGFLLYCQVLVLSAMDAWVNGEDAAGEVSLGVGAGMAAWVGGYGIGLIDQGSGTDLPAIQRIR